MFSTPIAGNSAQWEHALALLDKMALEVGQLRLKREGRKEGRKRKKGKERNEVDLDSHLESNNVAPNVISYSDAISAGMVLNHSVG